MRITQTQRFKLPPLSTLPAFASAARTGSLTLTAREMNLTPGAISRQIKSLEDALGVSLFHRSHNAISLTDAGRQYLAHVSAALATIENGTRALQPDRATLVIQAPITLARRWLIPRLGSYRQDNPNVDLSIQSLALGATGVPDVVITYRRGTTEADFPVAFLLDRSIAVCSPLLSGGSGPHVQPQDLLDLPLLLDTADAWSWQRWCGAAQMAFKPRGGSIAFDTDEASIDACISGLGIGQASPSLIERELREGQLIALCPAINPIVGAYEISISTGTPSALAFNDWLSAWRETGGEQ
ncbi:MULTISPECIES: LysR substrate-binding domain-containing protein [Sinorhizobium]|uniref:LysR family transcriptional regulator n=2 Tax=Sinorhizobium TaxID=28105 RepID=A0A2S3YNV4_9HYPH|nr:MULTISPECIES: LysR substrate-binding domain-containing protein [Sinorhizobium]ASY56515.1 Transcriptional regulator, LysR family [Sinorhizobium sp. CCBAU 05631]AUX76437.1 LysR family transcriptional regulator protein [Sinorhizobium fredii]PDT42689.1 LysR family transcriptional regulator [Sinorhizobium sp. FG01]POH32614.1 LysR family transcriptional regulator [Sinorhizobium americanum]